MDWSKTTQFQTRVYKALLFVPPGKITTYAAIAKYLHSHPRAVGQALKRNPFAPTVPCHRCVKSSGLIGGFHGSNPKNIQRKIDLLRKEGITFRNSSKGPLKINLDIHFVEIDDGKNV